MANIVDLAKGLFTDNILSGASAALGENSANVNKAVDGIVPSILAGLLNKAGSGSNLSSLVNSASELTSGSGNLSDLLGGALSSGANSSWLSKGLSLLQSIFGSRLGNITSMISGFSGVKDSSASSLLSMAVPAILSLIGRHGGSDEKGILGFLNGQKENILGSVPSGLNLSSALGLGSLSELSNKVSSAFSSVGNTVSNAANTTSQYVEEKKKGSGGWLWILLLALAALALWYFLKDGCNKQTDTPPVNDTAVHDTTSTTTTTTTTVRTLAEVVLPNGVKLQAYPGGIEDQLVKFIQSDEYKNGTDSTLKDKWFNFDDLNFNFGTTELTDSSKRQLDNIAAILKAFPDVKIKVGGYTDKKGDDAANLKLSDGRAKAVQAKLKAAGVGAQVPEAEGYGEKFATVDENADDKSREADRKTAVRLIK